ncbi:hypothetical protein BD779DRAFT_1470298 [Infundibulicybe gibba]|nr:hypothetical protein BD779DRAFT_1470298 [Infundibulicybe gibba]
MYNHELSDNQHRALQQRFPRAGYWFNMLPSHPRMEAMHAQQHPPPARPILPPPPPYIPASFHLATTPTIHLHILRSEIQAGVVGGIVTRAPLRLSADLSYANFFSRICTQMELDPLDALLAMAKVVGKMRRVRTRDVVMEIYNLQPAREAAAAAVRGRKRGLHQVPSRIPNSEPETTFLGDATLTEPPSSLEFDHKPKRRRRYEKWCQPPAHQDSNLQPTYHMPVIPASQPLDLSPKSTGSIIDLTASDDENPLIQYPTISTLLKDLHDIKPQFNYPQYESVLHANGFVYVNSIIDSDIEPNFFVDIIGIPWDAVGDFFAYAETSVRCAQKGKARACANVDHVNTTLPKKEEDGNRN